MSDNGSDDGRSDDVCEEDTYDGYQKLQEELEHESLMKSWDAEDADDANDLYLTYEEWDS
jgi:hypothetical protein